MGAGGGGVSRRMPCIYCTEDLHCTKFSEPDYESWCVLGPCTNETPSNADKLRTMSDEELAEFLTTEDMCELICAPAPPHCDGQCKQKMLGWLRQEATDA